MKAQQYCEKEVDDFGEGKKIMHLDELDKLV